jgi:hypothetical protein
MMTHSTTVVCKSCDFTLSVYLIRHSSATCHMPSTSPSHALKPSLSRHLIPRYLLAIQSSQAYPLGCRMIHRSPKVTRSPVLDLVSPPLSHCSHFLHIRSSLPPSFHSMTEIKQISR